MTSRATIAQTDRGAFGVFTEFTMRQAKLKQGREPLQIPVPPDFQGERSSEQSEIHISTDAFMPLTADEIALVESFLTTLPYKQSLVFGATMIDANDPLLDLDHQMLDRIEQEGSFACSRYVSGGGRRSIYERVLILREAGFHGSGLKTLAGV